MNPNLAIEVCSLQEAGFKLADYQRDLTFKQLLFLNDAYPIYNKHIKELSENEDDSSSASDKESWREEYRRKIEEKRQKEGY